MTGDIGDVAGAGGLGLTGVGEGGGGDSIGLGSLGTIGRGGGSGYGEGYGSGAGMFGSRCGAGAIGCDGIPGVRLNASLVQGGLDRELIRRVVRAHLKEVRGCYDRVLERVPTATGRVSVTWRIEESGEVSFAQASSDDFSAGSSENAEATAQCIEQAVARWSFPRARNGGTTRVTYPFFLMVLE
jgi:hypothetical protein